MAPIVGILARTEQCLLFLLLRSRAMGSGLHHGWSSGGWLALRRPPAAPKEPRMRFRGTDQAG
jgi:hypothetical protein